MFAVSCLVWSGKEKGYLVVYKSGVKEGGLLLSDNRFAVIRQLNNIYKEYSLD